MKLSMKWRFATKVEKKCGKRNIVGMKITFDGLKLCLKNFYVLDD